MRTLLCLAILCTGGIGASQLGRVDPSRLTFTHPASASDLKNFYRSIRALIGDPVLNETAVRIV